MAGRRLVAGALALVALGGCVRAEPAAVGTLNARPQMREVRSNRIPDRIIAVSPDGRLVFKTVHPKREDPLRADLQLVRDGEEVIWFKDLSRYVVPDFGTGVWFRDRVAMPSAPVLDDGPPVETSLSLVEMRFGRRPKLIDYWKLTPPNTTEAIGAIAFESRDVVSFTVYRSPEAGPSVRYRCIVGRRPCSVA